MGWLVMKKLKYDETCPICRTFKTELELRSNGEIEFIPLDPDSTNFEYENEQGTFIGKEAISVLLKDFPNLVPSLNVLPLEMREGIMNVMYSLSSIGRTLYKKTISLGRNKKPGGCNCGK